MDICCQMSAHLKNARSSLFFLASLQRRDCKNLYIPTTKEKNSSLGIPNSFFFYDFVTLLKIIDFIWVQVELSWSNISSNSVKWFWRNRYHNRVVENHIKSLI